MRTLLVVNCALDGSYANRGLLHELYRPKFPDIAFTISPTCVADPAYWNIRQSWIPPIDDATCLCGNPALGTHPAVLHSFHPRLVDVANVCHEFDYVVFTEDDCLLSPRIGGERLRQWSDDFDCVVPPIFPCSRERTNWMWTSHSAVFPKFAEIAGHFDGARLVEHWHLYRGEDAAALPPSPELPLFCGFADWLALRVDFLRALADDLIHLQHVWHEVAIPTAILHRTSRVGVSNGQALWGEQRQQPLDALMTLLATHDFVHPVKLLGLDPATVIKAYCRAAVRGMSNG